MRVDEGAPSPCTSRMKSLTILESDASVSRTYSGPGEVKVRTPLPPFRPECGSRTHRRGVDRHLDTVEEFVHDARDLVQCACAYARYA